MPAEYVSPGLLSGRGPVAGSARSESADVRATCGKWLNIGVLGYAMKPRDSAVRAKRFEVAEKARKVASLEGTIRDFENLASELARQVANEEDRTGIRDQAHFAYSTFAKAAAQRRVNLLTSVDDLKEQLEAARHDYEEAALALKRLELPEERERAHHKGDPRAVAGG
jgi:flagellar FliJ protein